MTMLSGLLGLGGMRMAERLKRSRWRAFKDRATADSVATRLKEKGYEAYVVAPDGPEGGLFNVRVGSYPARADAERTQAKLRDEEKYKPFIVKN